MDQNHQIARLCPKQMMPAIPQWYVGQNSTLKNVLMDLHFPHFVVVVYCMDQISIMKLYYM